MTRSASRPLRALLLGTIAAMVAASAAMPAAARIVFDGNNVFHNGNLTYPAGQYTGAASAAVAACPGKTTLELATFHYVNNVSLDPLLPNAAATAAIHITRPDFQPLAGSPMYVGNDPSVRTVQEEDSFFDATCYLGGVGPNPGDRWWEGWTYFDSTGTGRQDLHLPGMPNPRPLVILSQHSFFTNRTFSADSNYLLRGFNRVKSGATLTIPAGTVIFGERATLGTLIAERGGKFNFAGTAAAPIIFTSDDAPGLQRRGGWGGIWLLGRAVANCANTAAGDSCISEGGAIGSFGGNNDDDDSGVMRYVRCEYAGAPIATDNELNAFTFDAVGRSTRLEFLQAHRGDDDLFEFFGGVAQLKHIVGTDGNDDGFDWQMGYRGRAQFGIIRLLADGLQTDKGIEADNNEFNFDTPDGPRSNPIVSNFTFIGDRRSGAGYPGCTFGVHLRRGTLGTVVNSIVTHWKSQALRLEHDATWAAACAAGFTPSDVQCGTGSLDVPAGRTGTVFVSQALPNPFRSRVDITFTLPTASDVVVDVYALDGRRVARVADDRLAAGPHRLAWNVGRDVPSGAYFYRVLAGDQRSEGRVVRVH